MTPDDIGVVLGYVRAANRCRRKRPGFRPKPRQARRDENLGRRRQHQGRFRCLVQRHRLRHGEDSGRAGGAWVIMADEQPASASTEFIAGANLHHFVSNLNQVEIADGSSGFRSMGDLKKQLDAILLHAEKREALRASMGLTR